MRAIKKTAMAFKLGFGDIGTPMPGVVLGRILALVCVISYTAHAPYRAMSNAIPVIVADRRMMNVAHGFIGDARPEEHAASPGVNVRTDRKLIGKGRLTTYYGDRFTVYDSGRVDHLIFHSLCCVFHSITNLRGIAESPKLLAPAPVPASRGNTSNPIQL